MSALTSSMYACSRSETSGAAPSTILVVDDHPALCHVACLLLERCGYRVLSATSGEDAKNVARMNRIDLLLTDVEMPAMNGDELAAWFRTAYPQTTIVYMSGNPMQQWRLKGCHFIEKPFVRLDLLVGKVQQVFEPSSEEPTMISNAA